MSRVTGLHMHLFLLIWALNGIMTERPTTPCARKRCTASWCVVEMSNCLDLTLSEVSEFQELLGLIDWTPNEANLTQILRTSLALVPFTNIMMLARPRMPPSRDEIVEDMLSKRGGPCGHYNPFIASFLHELGFDSYLVPAWMGSALSHIAVVVNFDERKFWLDCGNGHAYLTPLEMTHMNSTVHAGLEYSIRESSGGMYHIHHKRDGDDDHELNYSFLDEPVGLDYFEDMVRQHYTESSFGPFLNGLRLVHFPCGELFAIRDFDLLFTVGGELNKQRFSTADELRSAVCLGFPDQNYPLDAALEFLGWDV